MLGVKGVLSTLQLGHTTMTVRSKLTIWPRLIRTTARTMQEQGPEQEEETEQELEQKKEKEE